MKNLKTIQCYIEDDNTNIPTKAVGFMNFWQERLNQIPEEFISSARIEIMIGSYYSEPFLQVDITYERPETKDEMLESEKLDSQRTELERNIKMQKYEKLKEELFGMNNK